MTIYGFNSYVEHYAPVSSVELTSDSLVVPVEHEASAALRYDEYEQESQRVPWAYGATSASIGVAGILFFVFATLMSAEVIARSFLGITLAIIGVVMLAVIGVGASIENRFHRTPLKKFKDDLIDKFDARAGFPQELIPVGNFTDEELYSLVELMEKKRFTERRLERFSAGLERLERLVTEASARQRLSSAHESREATCASLAEAVRAEEQRLDEIDQELKNFVAKVSS